MIRRMVVLPLPEAPSSTSVSPSATSKEMSSSTDVSPNRLLRACTRAAAGNPGSGTGEELIISGTILIALAAITTSSKVYVQPLRLCTFAALRGKRRFTQRRQAAKSQRILINIHPLTGKEQHAKNQKRK